MPMKIQIASDLHLEFLQQTHSAYRIIEPADADVLVLAGDIHSGTQAIAAFNDWPVPVIYIHGNHELYHDSTSGMTGMLRDAAQNTNVHYLENDEVVLNGVRFLGCCLWTDYELTGNRDRAMTAALRCMRDHQVINTDNGAKFMPQDALALHQHSRAWLERKLNTPFDGATVVVTHHGPHPLSIHENYAGDPANAAFHSDLTALMGKAVLWIHGHTHSSTHYNVAGTEVVVNPCGYPENRHMFNPDDIRFENPDFNRKLVVWIDDGRAVLTDANT